MLSCVFAATVTRNMPSTIEPGKELEVNFNVADMEVGQSVTISDTLPSQLSLKEWSVTGANKGDVTYEVKGKEYRWEIPATSTTVKLTYKVAIPSSASGNYEFDAVYFAPPAKMDQLKATLNVAVKKAEPAPAPTPAAPTPTPKPAEQPPAEEAKTSSTGIIAILAIVIIGVIAYFAVIKKKKK